MSYLAYASLQRRLLRAGEVRIPMVPMTGISLAGNAIQNSLPGGVVFYAAYVFRQYRRFGADDVLAGWTLVAVERPVVHHPVRRWPRSGWAWPSAPAAPSTWSR